MLMLRIFDWATLQLAVKGRLCSKLLPRIFSVAAILLPSSAYSATIDWNAASGNWNANTNWYDYTAAAVPASPPGAADDTNVRNGGTVTLSDNQSALDLLIGFARNVELDPVNQPGVLTDVGLDGALTWTGGTLSTANIRVGKEHNGVVNQSGGDISLPLAGATFRLGDSGTPAGTGTYTMTGGSITLQGGTNSNNGLEIINGTFNMKGGTITQTAGT